MSKRRESDREREGQLITISSWIIEQGFARPVGERFRRSRGRPPIRRTGAELEAWLERERQRKRASRRGPQSRAYARGNVRRGAL